MFGYSICYTYLTWLIIADLYLITMLLHSVLLRGGYKLVLIYDCQNISCKVFDEIFLYNCWINYAWNGLLLKMVIFVDKEDCRIVMALYHIAHVLLFLQL